MDDDVFQSLKARLLVGIALPIVIVLVVGGVVTMTLSRARDHLESAQQRHKWLETYLELALVRNEYLVTQLRSLSASGVQSGLDSEEAQEDVDRVLDVLFEQLQPEQLQTERARSRNREKLADLEQTRDAFLEIDRRLDQLAAAKTRGEELPLDSISEVLGSEAKLRFRRLLAQAIERERAESEAAFATEQDLLVLALYTDLFVGASVATGIIGLGVVLMRSIQKPVDALLAGTERIARDDFTRPVEIRSPTELARLGKALNTLAARVATKRRQLEQAADEQEARVEERTAELVHANETLARQSERRRRLFADLSHELRTPLTAMRGEAEVTLRTAGHSSDEYRNGLTRIVDQASHAGNLVEDLLLLARGEAEDMPLQEEPVDLAELLQSVCADLTTTAADRGIELHVRRDGGGGFVHGDPHRLHQVFTIIVDNAVRYSEDGSRVEVRLLVGDSSIEASVSDRGAGIDAAELPRVFDRFYRGREAQRRRPQGAGLGLAIAKMLVERHGGTIEIDSTLAEGTTATVRLQRLAETQT